MLKAYLLLLIVGLSSYIPIRLIPSDLFWNFPPGFTALLLPLIMWILSFILFMLLTAKLNLYRINKFVALVAIVILFYVSVFLSLLYATSYLNDKLNLNLNPFSNKSSTKREGVQIDPTSKVKTAFETYLPREIGDLKIVDLFEKEYDEKGARGIETESGVKPVSLIEGYRAIYAFPDGAYFANMHVDKSALGRFEKDKQSVIKGLEYTMRDYKELLTKHYYQEIEYYQGITSKGVPLIGQAQIFFPKDEVIVTIYFLDRNLSKEDLEDIEKIKEQRKLQNEFIKEIIESASND